MSWICDICSTSNEDKATECFVCGQSRSEESIREEKRRKKEERKTRRHERLCKYSKKVAMITFIASASLSVLTASVMLAILAVKGELPLIAENGASILKRLGENVSRSLGSGPLFLFRDKTLPALSDLTEKTGETVHFIRSEKLPDLGEKTAVLFGRIGASLKSLWERIVALCTM